MKAREYIPQLLNPEQIHQKKKLDEMFSIDLDRNNEPDDPEEFKAESYALPAKFITKDEGADQEIALKIQVLVDRLNDYKTKCSTLRDTNLESAKENFEKSKELERLKLQNEQLEHQLSEMNVYEGKRGKGGVIALRNKSNADEEYRRRQEMRKELVMGIALVEGEMNEFGGRQASEKRWFQKIIDGIEKCFMKFIILKGDVKRIESIYDKSISSYFGFYKFVANLSILILAIYSYLLVSHIMKFSGSLSSVCQGTPCFTLYYSFSSSEAFVYTLTLICLIVATLIVSIGKWIRADKLRNRTEIYAGNDAKMKKFSAIVFNSWPWAINTETDSEDQSVNLSNLISTAITDHIKQREAANRTAKQKTALFGKRVIGSIIFFLILSSGWVIIVLLAVTEKDIANSYSTSSQGLSIFMKFLPKVGVSVVNALFPALTLKITALENWDTPGFIIKIQIVRIYVAKILNIVLYAGMNLELATDNSWFRSGGTIPFQSTSYNCREDQVGLNLMLLVISEAITSKVIPLLTAFTFWILSKCKKATTWKKEIKVSQQVINLIYFQSLLWITLPYFPYVLLLAPFFLFIDFKFQSWKLYKLQIKPLEQTQSFEVIILIMRLFNLTLVLVLAYFGYFLTVEITHLTYGSKNELCGPYQDLVAANYVFIEYMKTTSGLNEIWTYFLDYSPVFWIILILSISRNLFMRNHLIILREYITDKEIETENQVQELQKINSRLIKQNELNKKLD